MKEAADALNCLMPDLGRKDAHECFKPLAVVFCKTADVGTVEVQNADNAALCADGNDDLSVRGAIARDMSGEPVNVADKLRFALCRRRAADAAPKRNLDTGGLALKWAENENAVLHQIEARPIEILERVEKKRRRIGKVCSFMRYAANQRRELLIQCRIVCHCVYHPLFVFQSFARSGGKIRAE